MGNTDLKKGEEALRQIYSILLDIQLPGLSEQFKKLGAFDYAFNWWVDNQVKQVLNIEQLNDEIGEAVDEMDQMAITMRLHRMFFATTLIECSQTPTD